MPLAAVVTIIGALATALVLAAYLIRVALILRHVTSRLDSVYAGIASIGQKTEPVGPIVGEINEALGGVNGALQGVLTKKRGASVVVGRGVQQPSRPGVATASAPAAVQAEAAPAAPAFAPVNVLLGSPRPGVRVLEQRFALFAGSVYVFIGVVGFFYTGFGGFVSMSNNALFGIFHINPFHNIVHIAIGALWLFAAFVLTRPGIQGVNLAIGGFYVLAAVLGYLGYLNDLLAVHDGPLDADNFLHLVTGVVSLAFAGLIPWPEGAAPAQAGKESVLSGVG